MVADGLGKENKREEDSLVLFNGKVQVVELALETTETKG